LGNPAAGETVAHGGKSVVGEVYGESGGTERSHGGKSIAGGAKCTKGKKTLLEGRGERAAEGREKRKQKGQRTDKAKRTP